MRRQELYNGFRAWLVSASGLPLGSVYRQPFNGAIPPTPAISFQFLTETKIGWDATFGSDEDRGTGSPIFTHSGQREVNVSVQAYGCADISGERIHAVDFLEMIRFAMIEPERKLLAEAAGFAVADVGGITDVSTLRDTSFEEQAAMDVTIRYVQTRGFSMPAPVLKVETTINGNVNLQDLGDC